MPQALLDHVLRRIQIVLVRDLPDVGATRHQLGRNASVLLCQVQALCAMLEIMLRARFVRSAQHIALKGLRAAAWPMAVA